MTSSTKTWDAAVLSRATGAQTDVHVAEHADEQSDDAGHPGHPPPVEPAGPIIVVVSSQHEHADVIEAERAGMT